MWSRTHDDGDTFHSWLEWAVSGSYSKFVGRRTLLRSQVRALLVLPLLVTLTLLLACAWFQSIKPTCLLRAPSMSSLVHSAAWDCRTVCCTSAASPSRPSTLCLFEWLLFLTSCDFFTVRTWFLNSASSSSST